MNSIATPPALPGRYSNTSGCPSIGSSALASGEAEPERIALGAEKKLAGLHRRRDEAAEVVGGHELDRRAAEDARAFERAAVHHRLREADVVGRGRDPAGAARIVLRHIRH